VPASVSITLNEAKNVEKKKNHSFLSSLWCFLRQSDVSADAFRAYELEVNLAIVSAMMLMMLLMLVSKGCVVLFKLCERLIISSKFSVFPMLVIKVLKRTI
jgi:hypothetical protein